MSRFDTDDEQVAAIKQWWHKNGTQLLSAVLVVAVSWSGWTYWQNTKMVNAINASSIFEVVQAKASQNALGDVLRDGLTLMEDQPESPYASAVAMIIAKYHFDKKEMDKAIEKYQWVITHNTDVSLQLVAQLRLVSLHIQQQQFDDATAVLNTVNLAKLSEAEQGNYDFKMAELAIAKGDQVKAKEALQKVVDNQKAIEGIQGLAKLKLDDLAG